MTSMPWGGDLIHRGSAKGLKGLSGMQRMKFDQLEEEVHRQVIAKETEESIRNDGIVC